MIQRLFVNDSVRLDLLDDTHAASILELVNDNRDRLGEWFPWVAKMHTLDDFQRFTAASRKSYDLGTDHSFLIFFNDVPAGRIGIYDINRDKKLGSVGYWLGKDFTGKGIVTQATETLIDYGFRQLGLDRIEIKCGTANLKSQAIPLTLGFTLEGVIERGEFIQSKFIDLNRYVMLKETWERRKDKVAE